MAPIIRFPSAIVFNTSLILFLFFGFRSTAQIEGLVVETYYISDAIDATDTTGGGLAEGSITYRIFVDLAKGSRVKKIYGDQYHPLKINSTEVFFNNKADGRSFGKDFNKNRFQENTVVLDTWLTIGQMTQYASKTYYGVPKEDDRDGSFVGGQFNDGGSAGIAAGLLSATNPLAGIPLTQKDGIDTIVAPATSWASYGIVDFTTQNDSTIFGSLVPGNSFVSYDAGLISSAGAYGVDREKNIVLLAQLTTKGQLSFEINLVVEQSDGVNSTDIHYVANADTLLEGETLSPFLKYPFVCGCTDPDYIEYSDRYACNVPDSCRTKFVLGCSDTAACNYDPKVNFNVPQLCCYPGLCADRDIKVLCPKYYQDRSALFMFPNPAKDNITLRNYSASDVAVSYSVSTLSGVEIISSTPLGNQQFWMDWMIDISALEKGAYFMNLKSGELNKMKLFFVEE
ncbi:MAG: Secretion system C-terminal sorting domain [Bacteroidota bacterium]|jgi:hypothetical protein